jgi:precorrin-8X/cobalt-precorrin-8 methylmutase
VQASTIAQINHLDTLAQGGFEHLDKLWDGLDAAVHSHPESFDESLQQLLPNLSDRSEIEIDLLTQLVLACGDVSLIPFVKLGNQAIAAGRSALQSGCTIVTDVPAVAAVLDQTRLAHLNCTTQTLINNEHISNTAEAEQQFWQYSNGQQQLETIPDRCILIVGYTPSVLLAVCNAVEQQAIRPALVVAMPIGFSHAPAAKRRLMRSGLPYITIAGTLGGGLLAATALNAIMGSLIEKPDCHCHLGT